MDVLVYNGKAGIKIYATPSQARILKIVVSLNQADAHFIKFLVISKAAN